MPSPIPLNNEKLRAEISQLISAFGTASAFWGVSKKNAKPIDPTDQLMALFHQALEAREVEGRIATVQVILNTCKYSGRELFLSTGAVENMLTDLQNNDDSHKVLTAIKNAALQQSSKDGEK